MSADDTRRKLLEAAQRRFVLLGYDRATTRDIAADAGVNISLIARYYGSKEGLYEAVLDASAELLEGVRPSDDPLEDFLERMDPAAWPELGAHPLLLMLRDDGDERIRTMRRQILERATARLAGDGDPLRAQLSVALLCGTLVLRRLELLEPLASADADALRPGLQDALDALLGPTGRAS